MTALAVIEPETETVVLPPANSLSLAFSDDMPFDEWRVLGRHLAARERVLNWWIGDWYRFGVRAYGEALADHTTQELWGLQAESVRKYGWVAEKFPPVRRLTSISFSHHHEVAALPPDEADALLLRSTPPSAEEKGLSTRELRIEAMKRKVHLGIIQPRDQAEDDPEQVELVDLSRRWNRARFSVRREFLELLGFEEPADDNLQDLDP